MKKIQILGAFNSGTNLLAKILNNAANEKIYLSPCGSTYFWKHNFRTMLKYYIRLIQIIDISKS